MKAEKALRCFGPELQVSFQLPLLSCTEAVPPARTGQVLKALVYLFPKDHDSDSCIVLSKVLPFFYAFWILLTMVGGSFN